MNIETEVISSEREKLCLGACYTPNICIISLTAILSTRSRCALTEGIVGVQGRKKDEPIIIICVFV